MKKLLLIAFILLLTGCTREYFVFVYVQPEKKDSDFGRLSLPIYRKECADPGCCVNHNYEADTTSFIYKLNRGDFNNGSLSGKLSVEDLNRIIKESEHKADSVIFKKIIQSHD